MQLKTLKQHKVKRSKAVIYALLLLALCKTKGLAQDVLPLTERVFLQQVLLYHPRLMSEELEVERAKQNIQVARAAFDPVWKSEFKAKEFEGKDYYDYQHSSFSWQAPPGIQFKAGVDRNRGDFVNPEFSTPAEGLAFAEIAIPLGDGLFRTEDQTKLQKSRLAADQAIVQLEVLSRGVIYSSSELFWNWIASQRELAVRQEIAELVDSNSSPYRDSTASLRVRNIP
jgi:outer membrane protein TolC